MTGTWPPAVWVLGLVGPWICLNGIQQATTCQLSPGPSLCMAPRKRLQPGGRWGATQDDPNSQSHLQSKAEGSYSGDENWAWSTRAVPEEEELVL